jgi:hypothetical protein
MIAAFLEQPATARLEVVDQRASLYALILRGSRMTGPATVVC